MSAEILISIRPQETRVAFMENGSLSEFKVERRKAPMLAGSIHKGRVTRVLPGMQAAFVDIGTDRAAFLYVGDIIIPETKSETVLIEEENIDDEVLIESPIVVQEERPPIQDLLAEGQKILVQVSKDPIGTKGARLTTHISLPGRYLVYMPTVDHIGISRRIEDEDQRERLKALIDKMDFSGGLIVRTAGEEASAEELKLDLEYLVRLWKEISKNYEKRKTAGLIHAEADIEMRALRDLLNQDISMVYIDDEPAFKKVHKFVSQVMPKFKQKIKHYDKSTPLFDMYDIDVEISRSLDRQVWLKSGGYIVIDEAEALVVIDINTGKFVGKKDFEDTILKTNLEAAKEICNQIKIRNVGGIIIIDFIDMEKQAHREMLLHLLEEELKKDRVKTKIVSMSELGLVEMTRKRTRPSLTKTLCEPCSYCDGKGYLKKKATITHEIFREIERQIPFFEPHQKPIVMCHSDIVDWIYESEMETLERIESLLETSIVFKVDTQYHIEQFEISTP